MSSLVGYGVSSDSEEEEEGRTDTAEKGNEASAEGEKKRNFLMQAASDSGEFSSESESEPEPEQDQEGTIPPSLASSSEPRHSPSSGVTSHKLPPPPLEEFSSGGQAAQCSVFANPFKERAEERLNALQKHVPLTLQALPAEIGGKRICMAYRKDGRCRFGSRCKFAHDSDLQSNAGLRMEPVTPESGSGEQAKVNSGPPPSSDSSPLAVGRDGVDEEESHKRKKQRVGLSDTLIPPKRALKQYAMQKDRFSHS